MDQCLRSDTRWNNVLDALYVTGSYRAAQSPAAHETSPVEEIVARDYALPALFEWTRPIGRFVAEVDTSDEELTHLLQFQCGRIWQTIAANARISTAERLLRFLRHSDGVLGLGLNLSMTSELKNLYDAECYAVMTGRVAPWTGDAPHGSPPLPEDYLEGLCQAAVRRPLSMHVMYRVWQDLGSWSFRNGAMAAVVLAHCWHINPSEWVLETSPELIRYPMVRAALLHHPGTSTDLRRALLRTDHDTEWDRTFVRDWLLQRSFHDQGATDSLAVLAREFPATDPLWPVIALHRGITPKVWRTMKARDTLQALFTVEQAVERRVEAWGTNVRDAISATPAAPWEPSHPFPLPLAEALKRLSARVGPRPAKPRRRPSPSR
jgi:hypothetical protein